MQRRARKHKTETLERTLSVHTQALAQLGNMCGPHMPEYVHAWTRVPDKDHYLQNMYNVQYSPESLMKTLFQSFSGLQYFWPVEMLASIIRTRKM